MAKRARKMSNDLIERLKVVGSVSFFALCGLALTALALWGPYGWIFSLLGIILLVLVFLFWPHIPPLFRSLVHPKPRRAFHDE